MAGGLGGLGGERTEAVCNRLDYVLRRIATNRRVGKYVNRDRRRDETRTRPRCDALSCDRERSTELPVQQSSWSWLWWEWLELLEERRKEMQSQGNE